MRMSHAVCLRVSHICVAIFFLTVIGCSSVFGNRAGSGTNVIPAERPVSEVVKPDVQYPIDVYDPMEGFNRRMYNFNAKFDRYVYLPVVKGYETITPDFLEQRISNLFSNISDIRNLLNSLLQAKGTTSAKVTARFLINSTIGIGGLWDPATGMGFPQYIEDFGQTLGQWGVGAGPYMVLPIFGPSSVRDATGLVMETVTRYLYLYVPLGLDAEHAEIGYAYTTLNSIDIRHQIPFRYYQTGSPFEYDLVRYLYTKKRDLEIEK